jgi:hypothetical protein
LTSGTSDTGGSWISLWSSTGAGGTSDAAQSSNGILQLSYLSSTSGKTELDVGKVVAQITAGIVEVLQRNICVEI